MDIALRLLSVGLAGLAIAAFLHGVGWLGLLLALLCFAAAFRLERRR
ncbi:hypothetical protein [Microcystis phage vB_MweS-yong2]|nr:hypothetical protein [Microcystis phage vB_MweS-yong2]